MTLLLLLVLACTHGGDPPKTDTAAPTDTGESGDLESGDSEAIDSGPTDTCPLYDSANGGPVACDRDSPWSAVAAGWYQTCGVHVDGCAECWGIGIEESQPEEYVDRYHYRCEDRPPAADYASIVMMRDDMYGFGQHACGLTTAGEAVCWGEDSNNELSVPAGPWVGVALWQFGTYLVADDGSVWAGEEAYIPESGTADLVVGEDHALALQRDGSVLGFFPADGFPSDEGTGFVAVDTYNIDCGVTTGGAAFCWSAHPGYQSWVDAVNADAPSSDVVDVCVHDHAGACVLMADGTVDCLGGDDVAPGDPDPSERFSTIACGFGHVCGVTTAGRLLCWGADTYGETDVPT